MLRGLRGADADGRRLLVNLAVSFLPAVGFGLLLGDAIKARLFGAGAVVAALAIGGAAMLWGDGWLRGRAERAGRVLETLTWREALLIGLAQCVALWPGTSRAMVTLVAGIAAGLPAAAAAEYSFLLALPTLGAATVLDALTGGAALLEQSSAASVGLGLASAAVVAALAMRELLRYLARWGLAPFGWYRVGVAAALWLAAAQR
jgi:undecaprenyl-diphosphatase